MQLSPSYFSEVSVGDFLKLCNDESSYIERFRSTVRAKIRERLGSGAATSARDIASDLEKEELRPGIAGVEDRFATAGRPSLRRPYFLWNSQRKPHHR